MRALLAALVLLGPVAATAQDLPAGVLAGIETTVRSCFAEVGPGEVAHDCIGAGAKACFEMPEGMTTIGITQCLGVERAVWEDLMNAEYKALGVQMSVRSEALNDKLLEAQRAWIAFRDADCAFDYARWGDGSISQISGASCLLEMTAARAIELRDKKDGS
ncbi:lysozyme inhibitor LprI family protein [Pseudothioclava arenosa]|uniref:Lysozyme inhibitor LprI-like N-terminal domain-containing protein n=1 Tax=Pseudothioclava arenosa TaxID=1795308 RepID=A0A2A4CTL8_9RHOB|nr:lysozyme inhibitor LprI family protein [Pseudothioclava arenosa]PCD77602.1 hypothetical protein CLN94_03610 [Pseudothioclava arenosa]